MKAENFTIKPILKDMVLSKLISSDEATRIFSNFKDDEKKHLNPLVAISTTIPSSKKDAILASCAFSSAPISAI